MKHLDGKDVPLTVTTGRVLEWMVEIAVLKQDELGGTGRIRDSGLTQNFSQRDFGTAPWFQHLATIDRYRAYTICMCKRRFDVAACCCARTNVLNLCR
jgi:hypothetical protein